MTLPVNPPPDIPDPLNRPTVKVAEFARIFGIGESAAYKAVKAGEIPAVRIGGRILIPTAALRRMLSLDEESSHG